MVWVWAWALGFGCGFGHHWGFGSVVWALGLGIDTGHKHCVLYPGHCKDYVAQPTVTCRKWQRRETYNTTPSWRFPWRRIITSSCRVSPKVTRTAFLHEAPALQPPLSPPPSTQKCWSSRNVCGTSRNSCESRGTLWDWGVGRDRKGCHHN